MATIKKGMPLHLFTSVVLKRCPRTENAVRELLLNSSHPCPVCGSSVEKCNGSQNYKFSPMQVDLFRNLILALTLETGGGGGGGGSDSLTMDQGEEDVQKFGCEECVAKFATLESLQNEISLLEDKVEDILRQLRKTIVRDRRGLISEPNLTVHHTVSGMTTHTHNSPLSAMGEEETRSTFTPIITTAENYDNQEIDLKPVVLEFMDDFNTDDPFGGVDLILEEHSINNTVQDQSNLNKSRHAKLRAKLVMTDILRHDDDANGDDEYSPTNNPTIDSDNTSEPELDSDTHRHRRRKLKLPGIPSHSSTTIQKEDEKDICTVFGEQVGHVSKRTKPPGWDDRIDRKRATCDTERRLKESESDMAKDVGVVVASRKGYDCAYCEYKFFSKSSANNTHLQQKHGAYCTFTRNEKKFNKLKCIQCICDECGGPYGKHKSLLVHKRKVHKK